MMNVHVHVYNYASVRMHSKTYGSLLVCVCVPAISGLSVEFKQINASMDIKSFFLDLKFGRFAKSSVVLDKICSTC